MTRTMTVVLRTFLGLIFVAAPLGTVLHLFPEPPLPPDAADFAEALARTGYMLPLLWATEAAAGALLLAGVLVPFALALLAPVVVNIMAFHLFLAPGGLLVGIVVSALELVLAWQYREAFVGMFAPATGRVKAAERIETKAA